MEAIVKERTVTRNLVTAVDNSIRAELTKESPNREQLEVWIAKCRRFQNTLTSLNDKIKQDLLNQEAVGEDAIMQEFQGCEEYSDKIEALIVLYVKAFKILPRDDQSVVSTVPFGGGVKLPQKTVPKFDGKVSSWLQWRCAWNVIHNHATLEDSQKFDYLVDALEGSAEAKQCIAAYLVTDKNYAQALEALKDRFGDEDVISEMLIMEILDLVTSDVKPPIMKLYDTLQGKLQALESLGRKLKTDSMLLFPMVKRCLSSELLLNWQRYISKYKQDKPDCQLSKLEVLMNWLREEVRNVQAIDFTSGLKRHIVAPTTIQLVSSTEPKKPKLGCRLCDGNHHSKMCNKAKDIPFIARIRKCKGACCKCFRTNHRSAECRDPSECQVCGDERHATVMCKLLGKNKQDSSDKKKKGRFQKKNLQRTVVFDDQESDQEEEKPKIKSSKKAQSPENITKTISQNVNKAKSVLCMDEVPLQTLRVIVEGPDGNQKIVRAMLDSGSQKTTLLRKTADELQLQPIGSQMYQHKVYGDHMSFRNQREFEVILWDLQRKDGVRMKVLDDIKIVSGIPNVGRYKEMAWALGVELSDCDGTDEIELLIGNDILGLITTVTRKVLQPGLVAVRTRLGWVLSGSTETESDAALVTASIINNCSLNQLFQLEVLGIRDPAEVKSKKDLDEEVKAQFLRNLDVDSEGRYEVRLATVFDLNNLVNNYPMAYKRLEVTTNKLRDQGVYQQYQQQFLEWLQLGVIEVVPAGQVQKDNVYYLPHRAVIKTSSATTKVRPVFDASAKTTSKYSLNDCCAKGPNQLELIPPLVIKFRLRAVGATSDIAKAFLQISVSPEDRDYLRFLWWDQNGQIVVYRHRRVVFGVNSSPFQLAAVLEYHLKSCQDSRREYALRLLNHLYVDNCVISLNTPAEYQDFKNLATELLAEAKMDLRLWESNCDNFEEDGNVSSSVLGLEWNRRNDTLQVKINEVEAVQVVTKRVILSRVNSVFDPVGFLAPVTLVPKKLLRNLVSKKLGWDEQVPEEVEKEFQIWNQQLQLFKSFTVPRRIADVNPGQGSWQLHVFTDASQDAFAAVIFVRVEDRGSVTVRLLLSKARVAPQKITIPRLELLGCLIGARLASTVVSALKEEGVEVPVSYWTDSKTALTWIRKEDVWGTFVQNRVKEIRLLSSVKDWKFVHGVNNPADLPSRGCSPKQLNKSNWQDGPQWLYLSKSEWPESTPADSEEALKERKKTVVHAVSTTSKKQQPWYMPFNSYNKNVRFISYILKWKYGTKSSGQSLSFEELKTKAEKVLWSNVQQDSDVPECEDKVKLLHNEVDNLWYVKTRITMRKNDLANFLMPVYLPKNHPIVEQYVKKVHIENCHALGTITMAKVRQQVWIKGLKKIVPYVLRKCFGCRKILAKPLDCAPAPLPADRVLLSRPMEIVGVDFGGHLFLKDGSKVWFLLVTDGVYRGVHLELVREMTTEAFLMAFRRFIARRGRPKTVYSDNGLNFVGAENLMRSLDWKKIQEEADIRKIKWKFSPSSAPWWGGFWERLVGLVKDMIRRNAGSAVLDYDGLHTLMCDIEAVVNSRPITYMSEDSEDFAPITPEMFLLYPETSELRTTDLDLIESELLSDQLKNRQQLLVDIKERFVGEYLAQLVEQAKKVGKSELKVGDIVVVQNDHVKKQHWRIARVLEIFPGRDGIPRAARLKLGCSKDKGWSTTSIIRPYQRIYPLELEVADKASLVPTVGVTGQDVQPEAVQPAKKPKKSARASRARTRKKKEKTSSSTSIGPADIPKTTRSGRLIKPPIRYLYKGLGYDIVGSDED